MSATSPTTGEYLAAPNRVLSAVDMRVFVANGDSDPTNLSHYFYLLAGLIPQAQGEDLPRRAARLLVQHHAAFADDLEAFLSEPQ